MKITDVKIKELDNNTNIKAKASVIFDDCFIVNNIKIIDGKYDTFVGMPSLKDDNDRYYDVAHPINATTKEYISQTVLEAYYKLKEEN